MGNAANTADLRGQALFPQARLRRKAAQTWRIFGDRRISGLKQPAGAWKIMPTSPVNIF
jgi:hypothetical protein